jgi:hypothetical protein
MVNQAVTLFNIFSHGRSFQGLDYACGSAPIGYELLKKGHKMDFVDVEGAGAYDFLKWRIKKNGFSDRAGWKLAGPYNFVLLLDAIEHLEDWEWVLDNIIGRMERKAVLITNYFDNTDTINPEHISMSQQDVADFLVSKNMLPITQMLWVKEDHHMGGPSNIKNVGGKDGKNS